MKKFQSRFQLRHQSDSMVIRAMWKTYVSPEGVVEKRPQVQCFCNLDCLNHCDGDEKTDDCCCEPEEEKGNYFQLLRHLVSTSYLWNEFQLQLHLLLLLNQKNQNQNQNLSLNQKKKNRANNYNVIV